MTPHTDEVLEALRPRMHTARVAHVRRMLAGLAMVPLIGVGAVAVAGDGTAPPVSETADDAPRDGDAAPDVARPEIGTAGELVGPDEGADERGATDVTETARETDTKVLGLGPLGTALISQDGGAFELHDTDLAAGWEVVQVDVTDDGIVIVVRKADALKVVTISAGVRDEIDVRIDDLVFPTTSTTTTPSTTTTAKPAPPPVAVDRFTVTVEGKGSFVVERRGGTLWVGQVSPSPGYDHEVVQGEGSKVFVRFTNGEWVWYGKALVNDAGEVEQHFWDEAPPFEPIHQWVEVPGVGAVEFKLWSDGLVYVKEGNPAEGYHFRDHHQGQPAEVARVDFEGVGGRWTVEAWRNDDGGLSHAVTDASTE